MYEPINAYFKIASKWKAFQEATDVSVVENLKKLKL
jgi:hypothetical protein